MSITSRLEHKSADTNKLVVTVSTKITAMKLQKLCKEIMSSSCSELEFKECAFTPLALKKILDASMQNPRLKTWTVTDCNFDAPVKAGFKSNCLDLFIQTVNKNKNLCALHLNLKPDAVIKNPHEEIKNQNLREISLHGVVAARFLGKNLPLDVLTIYGVDFKSLEFFKKLPQTLNVFRLMNCVFSTKQDENHWLSVYESQTNWTKEIKKFIETNKQLRLLELNNLIIQDAGCMADNWRLQSSKRWTNEVINQLIQSAVQHPVLEQVVLNSNDEELQAIITANLEKNKEMIADKNELFSQKTFEELQKVWGNKNTAGVISSYSVGELFVKKIEAENLRFFQQRSVSLDRGDAKDIKPVADAQLSCSS